MGNAVLEDTLRRVRDRWGEDLGASVAASAGSRLRDMCRENPREPRAVRSHTHKEIFPCIGVYLALQENGVSAEEALAFLDASWSARAEEGACRTRRMLSHLGLHRMYPFLFSAVAKRNFGERAGFRARFYDCGRGRCRFDMTGCLYLDVCTKYGCPELTVCFCHTDDVSNRDLHPDLEWNRTMYMGRGDPLCDFDIRLKEKR